MKRLGLPIFETSFVWIFAVSLAAVVFIASGAFTAMRSLAVGTSLFALTIGVLSFRGWSIQWRDERWSFGFVLLLLVAGALRWNQGQYIVGGQDQGVYTIMSGYLEKRGTPWVKDHFRDEFKKIGFDGWYDSHVQIRSGMESRFSAPSFIPGAYEGLNAPGVYISSLKNSEYVFQFYHLHPAWMAIFAKLFGEDFRQHSLFFFSLLGVMAFGLLAYRISNSRGVQYIATILFAIAPWHLFFSRYPLTEIQAGAMQLLTLYFISEFWRQSKKGGAQNHWLILALLAQFVYLFTRVSGIVWFPLFYAAFLWTFTDRLSQKVRSSLQYFTAAWMLLFGLSVVYGIYQSPSYLHDIYIWVFKMIFSENQWLPAVAAVFVLLVGLPLAMAKFRKFPNGLMVFKFLEKYLTQISAATLALIIFLTFVVALKVTLSDANPNDFLEMAFLKGKDELEKFQMTTLWATILHLGPAIFLLLLLSLWSQFRHGTAEIAFLAFVSVIAWYYSAYKPEYVAYQYYAIRYQVMEQLPLALLLAVIAGLRFCHSKARWRKAAVGLAFTVTLGQYFYFSSHILQGTEHAFAKESLRKIAERVGDGVLFTGIFQSRFGDVVTPLRYFFGIKQIYIVNLDELWGPAETVLRSRANFVLNNQPVQHPRLVLDSEPIMKRTALAQTVQIPTSWENVEEKWYLYRIVR